MLVEVIKFNIVAAHVTALVRGLWRVANVVVIAVVALIRQNIAVSSASIGGIRLHQCFHVRFVPVFSQTGLPLMICSFLHVAVLPSQST